MIPKLSHSMSHVGFHIVTLSFSYFSLLQRNVYHMLSCRHVQFMESQKAFDSMWDSYTNEEINWVRRQHILKMGESSLP